MFGKPTLSFGLVITMAILLGLVSFLEAGEDGLVELTNVEIVASEGSTQARIFTSEEVKYTDYQLEDPPRLVIEFLGKPLYRKEKQPLIIDQGRIKAISGGYYAGSRIAQNQEGINFLVFELTRDSTYQISKQANSIIVDVKEMPASDREKTMAMAMAIAMARLGSEEQVEELAPVEPAPKDQNTLAETKEESRVPAPPKTTKPAALKAKEKILPADTKTPKQTAQSSYGIFPMGLMGLNRPLFQAVLSKAFTISERLLIFLPGLTVFFGLGLFFYRMIRLKKRRPGIKTINPILSKDFLDQEMYSRLEKRRFPRARVAPEESDRMLFKIKGLYQDSPNLSSSIEGRIKNIGQGGLGFESNRKIRTPTLLQLEFSLSPSMRLKVLGNPVWQKKQGAGHEVGAAFFLLTDDDRDKIRQYVEDKAVNTKALVTQKEKATIEETLRSLGQMQENLVELLVKKGIIGGNGKDITD